MFLLLLLLLLAFSPLLARLHESPRVWTTRSGGYRCHLAVLPALFFRHALDGAHLHRWPRDGGDHHVLVRLVMDAHPHCLEPSRLQVDLPPLLPGAQAHWLGPNEFSEFDQLLIACSSSNPLPSSQAVGAKAQVGDQPSCVLARPLEYGVRVADRLSQPMFKAQLERSHLSKRILHGLLRSPVGLRIISRWVLNHRRLRAQLFHFSNELLHGVLVVAFQAYLNMPCILDVSKQASDNPLITSSLAIGLVNCCRLGPFVL